MGTPTKGQADYYEAGDFNAYCSMCGKKRKASQMVRNWQGMYRCPEHNEARQPQDFARALPDNMSTPWAQLLANSNFVLTCTLNGQSAIAGIAVAGCMRAGNSHYDPYGL